MRYRPEYDPKIIGKNLKRLRMAKNLSVDEVRQYLCMGTRQVIYKYESGKGYPQADAMLALMELYDANLHDIIDDVDAVTLVTGKNTRIKHTQLCVPGKISEKMKSRRRDVMGIYIHLEISKSVTKEETVIFRWRKFAGCSGSIQSDGA